MRRLAIFLVVLSIVALVTGCGRTLVPFTHEVRTQHQLTPADLKNLQFYLSHRVTLRRELDSGSRQITGNHRLLLVSGKTIEEVVVEEHTPGIAVTVDDSALSVSFEQGTSLVFSTSGELEAAHARASRTEPAGGFAEGPDPFPGNRGRGNDDEPEAFPGQGASVLGGRYVLATDRGGRVPFQGTPFSAVDDSGRAHLLIDAETLEKVVENRKVLPGVRLGGS
jgi:hypothetical protein